MTTFSTLLVGMHFRSVEAREIVSSLTEDSILLLEREPENAYDPNAIKVLFALDDRAVHLGYIAREDAAYIAPQMDEGGEFVASVTGFEQRGKNLHPLLSVSDE